ncbi:SitI3 family protein [Streptomyces sp. NPDC053427]|uniref:SitI3 family protein n=1 Tax=Streptomyces sp. NPDC053427 TaxID=3365701 RepID=UPI0037CD853A
MAIAYDLQMATAAPVGECARELCDVARSAGLLDASVTAGHLIGEGAVTGAGTWMRVGEERPPPWGCPVTEDLGFAPTVYALFRLGKSSDPSLQQDDMIRLASGLLTRIPGDAVLHFQYEVIWLLRRRGELSLNARDDLWRPHRLAAVAPPYRRATYAFAEE